MKLLHLFALTTSLFLYASRPMLAQELVTTGTVQQVAVAEGRLVVQSEQTKGLISFGGITAATAVTGPDGNASSFADLQPGTMVTVQYATRANVPYVSKIMAGMTPAVANVKAAAASVPTGGGVVPRSGMNATGYKDETTGVGAVNRSNRKQ